MLCFIIVCCVFILVRFLFYIFVIDFNIICSSKLSQWHYEGLFWNKLYQDLCQVFRCQGLLSKFPFWRSQYACVSRLVRLSSLLTVLWRDHNSPIWYNSIFSSFFPDPFLAKDVFQRQRVWRQILEPSNRQIDQVFRGNQVCTDDQVCKGDQV